MTDIHAGHESPALKWWFLWGLIAPINLLMALDRVAMTIASPKVQAQYGFDFVQTTTIISCVVWSYAALQIPAGWLVTRFGARRCMFVACTMWSLSTIATPLASGFWSFLILRLLLGVAQAPDWSASIVSVRNWFSEERRARANSILLGCLYLGSIVGGPLTTSLTTSLGWAAGFYTYGTAGIAISIAWWMLFRDRPARQASPALARSGPSRSRDTAKAFLRSTQFWSIGGHYLCVLTIQSFFMTILPHYLMKEKSISYASMGWLYGLPWLSLYVMVFASGLVADRILRRTGSLFLARTPLGMLGCLLGGAALEVGALCNDTWLVMTFFCISLGALGMSQVSIWSSVQDLTEDHTGIVAGWTTCWGNAANGVAPILMAAMARWTGSWPVTLLLPLAAGCLGAALAAATRPHRRIVVGGADEA